MIIGLYVAADPGSYFAGALRLAPPAYRGRIGAVLSDAGHALRRWLVGQVVSMITIGAMTTLATPLMTVVVILVARLYEGE